MKRILLSFLLAFVSFYTFAQIPAGYYDPAAGLSGAPLKTKLKEIISTGYVQHTYNDLWGAYQTTDKDSFYENDGTVLDIYSENPTGVDPYNFNFTVNQCGSNNGPEGTCYNREHIVPQSLFSENLPMKSDVHFIRPTDYKVNGMRSNYPFGVVETPTFVSQNGSKLGNSASAGYTDTVFEPNNAFKGDVARMVLYFVTRYEDQLSTFSTGNILGGSAFPGLQPWELNQLLAWHAADPVSPEEIARNNASYIYQNNRNPYIDHPEYVAQIWGTPVIDTQAPTAATNLIASNPTSNSMSLSWTAATDNIGVLGYDIYANNTFKTYVTGTSAVVSGLSPSTNYDFYVIAKDAGGNSSPQSNIAQGTTLAGQTGGSCGTETFDTIPTTPTPSSYIDRTWTNNGITWTATSARTDETINGKSITIRNGVLTSSTISGGVQSLTLTTQLKYTGSAGTLNVEVNGTVVGTIPYSATVNTTTINNINVVGNAVIKIITTSSSSNRIAMDDLSWTCNSTLGTVDSTKNQSPFIVYPNPVKNNELYVKGDHLSKISKAEIYDLSGKLIEVFVNPFKNSNKIQLKGLVKGNYILKTDNISTKFIVE
ncbi:endonuclease I [Chryseobacterium sp. T16E-39]|uniref:endonuclease n=1 Tax=Chryseobacterium sp. T16E-39 TaxID=2015076 RepID=UPI000B5B0F9D|nr:endonuclease [Chryseobacterium sp. T16E-39]ASK31914.1 endonuclease I [Chryseobacterium sp. T16E-39]